ncbi:MAG: endonuclease III domain-containing protein [Planctomycetota bacterium]|nr:endonuclease III domain-containing protein [Planctomycetota bacterium]
MSVTLQEVYQRLFSAFGPQHWWPGESPFEVMVGAVLVQNTAWKNVEKAIDNLRQADLLGPRPLYKLPVGELEELIRPAGYFRLKARRLRHLLEFIVEQHDASVETMFQTERHELREQLLSVHGVGPETADSILLYAGELPFFVIDTYTHRMMARHGWMDFDTDYHSLQEHFTYNLEEDVQLYNEFHALIVRLGHLHCRKTPKCETCPLAELLPGGRALERE